MPAHLFVTPRWRILDDNGDPVSGAKATFYIGGTTTKQDTYTTKALSVANDNPIIADSGGEFDPIFLDADKTYRVIITDSNDVEIFDEDNINDVDFRAPFYDTTTAEDTAGVTPTNYEYDPGDTGPGDITRFGATLDGSTSDATPINNADSVGVEILIPAGKSAKYDASTTMSNFDRLTLQAGADIVGYSDDSSIVAKDRLDNFIGLHHNYNEESSSTSAAISTGGFITPKIAQPVKLDIDVLAYWYNDFGLDSTRQADGGLGNVKWYDWTWILPNTSETDGYEQDRHPMLGGYRGDDSNVLDWICHDLLEAGVTAVVLIGKKDYYDTSWTAASDGLYWKYQLFNNVPNFKQLKYVNPITYYDSNGDILTYDGGSITELTDLFDLQVTNILSQFDNIYTIDVNGKAYALFFIWDSSELRTITDNLSGATNLESYFAYVATEMKTLGYGGAAFLTRNPTTAVSNVNGDANDWLFIGCDYSRVYGEYSSDGTTSHNGQTTYTQIINDFAETPLQNIRGTHTGSNNASTLTDSAADFGRDDLLIGRTIKNLTDGSSGTITDNDDTTISVTLSGGTDDDFDTSDEYIVTQPFEYVVPAIMCSRDSHSAHTSSFAQTGHTPTLFAQLVNKCANFVRNNREFTLNMMTIYNVSEWAEGGPGLIANMQDGHAYLDAILQGVGSGVAAQGTLIQADSAANIADQEANVNCFHKYRGKIVYDTTNKRLLRAAGFSHVDDWEVVDGSAQVTPS